MEEKLRAMMAERDSLRAFDDDEKSDKLREDILDFIDKHRNALSLEAILEGLTSTGAAPSLLYDDNGHWTVGGDGSQNLPTIGDEHKTKQTTFDGVWIVEAGRWKETVREAVNDYLDEK